MTENALGLKRTLSGWHLWGIAVGLVISGEYFGWSYGWAAAGTLGFLVTTVFIAVMYTTFIFSFTELTTAIPQAGGPYAYGQRAFGPVGGYVAGFSTLIEFLFAPPAIALAIGAYLNVQFPELDARIAAVGAYFVFMALNIAGVTIAATFELVVTVLAIVELLIFMGVVSGGFAWSNFTHQGWAGADRFSMATVGGIFAAIPFAIWFFLAIEGAAMAAEEAKEPTRTIPRAYIGGILTLVVLAFGTMIPDNVTARHCYAYQDGRRGEDGRRVPVAARHEIALLRHVFTKAIRWGIATKNPADGLELGPRSPKRSQVTLDQVEAVKAIATERMRAAIDLAVSIGQRRGDLLTLRWEHVTDAGVYIEQSKGGARVLIEHSPDLDAVLARLKALKPDIPREFLIRKRNGRGYTEDGFSAIWQRLQQKYAKAGGRRFTFHDLRSVSADGAATPEEARDRLGHASVETTKRHYLRGVTRAKPRS